MSVNIIPFRLRKRKDDDLRDALSTIPDHIDTSDVIREALRMYFFNAPTPLRSSYVRVDEAPKVLAPPPQRIEATVKLKDNPTTTAVSDLDDKLNKSLGF